MLLSHVVMATSKHTKSGDFEEAFNQLGEEMTDIWYEGCVSASRSRDLKHT